jgi:hypothetical protein
MSMAKDQVPSKLKVHCFRIESFDPEGSKYLKDPQSAILGYPCEEITILFDFLRLV